MGVGVESVCVIGFGLGADTRVVDESSSPVFSVDFLDAREAFLERGSTSESPLLCVLGALLTGRVEGALSGQLSSSLSEFSGD